MKHLVYLLSFLTLSSISAPVIAEDLDEKTMELELERLFEEVSRNPENLNNNYLYAQHAIKMGKYHESIAAYERMLIKNPKLDRVKLDLAVVYMKLGDHAQAKKLFLDVKSKNPPPTVLANIDKMLTVIDKGVKRHYFGASLTLGYNSDSNPSASPASGAVDVFGIGIPLDDASSGAADEQKFAYVGLNHTYVIPGERKHVWSSSASVYKAVQDNASDLNTTVYSLKTGPTFNTSNKKLKYGGKIGTSRVNLNEHEYLNSNTYEAFVDYMLSRTLKAHVSHVYEKRRFRNNPNVTTYEDRNGYTNEDKITLTSMLTPKDILNVALGVKREHARVDYYTNKSKSISFNYTKLLNHGFFVNTGVLYKNTKYRDVDTFVNPNVVRQDSERTFTLGAGHNLTDKLSFNMVYQHRNIDSNIQNYSYKNERVTASMNWKF